MNNEAIFAQHVTFQYADGTSALNGVDLAISPGEKTAIVGPNGAGKSTLLLALSGFIPFKGTIRVCGLQANGPDLKTIRRRMGIVFQNPDHQLFMPTVEEDVAFGPLNMGLSPHEVDSRVTSALEQTQTTHLRHKAAHHLSVGEKRRVAIATVLSMNPDILIMDEPSSNLDPRGRRNLIELLKTMPQTLLVVGHDLDMLLEVCPRTLIIDAGKIVADGPTEKVFSNPDLMQNHGLEVPPLLRQCQL